MDKVLDGLDSIDYNKVHDEFHVYDIETLNDNAFSKVKETEPFIADKMKRQIRENIPASVTFRKETVFNEYYKGFAKGWYGNISLSASMTTAPWSHLIFNPHYSDIVDVFEGGYYHARGTFRSESQSCMNTYIQYYNTISRELIVRRIMELTGETYSFEKFVSRDSREGLPQ